MSYNKSYKILSSLPTAGKVTILTTLLGVFVFITVFLLNLGNAEFQQVIAQDLATTSVTVLNTPPVWTILAHEQTESSTSTPTNSGDSMTWEAIATDSNTAPYQLLVCSENATPIPGTSSTDPTCGVATSTWAVSATTTSGAVATAATTTTEAAPFSERENWYAWVCDSIDLNARCNTTVSTGIAATNSSPFHVNSRPVFTGYWDDSPADPGALVIFHSTSSDPDIIGGNDTFQLVVCATSSYNGTTNACGGTTLATSSFVTSNATGTYTVVIPTQDNTYNAFGYIVDEHGHEASGGSQASDSVLTVNNVAPTVSGGTISINDGNDMILTTEQGETTGFKFEFTATDNNSCENSAAGEELTGYILSLYRSGIGSSTCDALTGTHDENNCYLSTETSAVWNLSCTATTTANDCNYSNDGIDRTRIFSCSFPLWFIADPTDGGATNTVYFAENWLAEVRAVDDDFATGTASETSTGQEVNSLLAFALNSATIPYGELEPGNNTGTLSASTTIVATGNMGIDQELVGESMCGTYTSGSSCPNSASSTIAASEQEYGTSSLAYGAGIALSSTTQTELEINVLKTTSTSTLESGVTYWGIAVPGSITLAGVYTGENTFYVAAGEPNEW